MNRIQELLRHGQSVWLDYIDRDLLASGRLKALVSEGVRGLTSNPSIFEKALAGGPLYDADILRQSEPGPAYDALFETLAVEDVRAAADLLRPVHDESQGEDGYVSLEVSPRLARDASGTVAEARRLWNRLDRPNVMIKIPATLEGLPAVEACLSEGINVNVTLIFSLARYDEVITAYQRALHTRAGRREPVRVSSVASFFVSRIDSAVDPLIQAGIGAAKSAAERDGLLEALGKTAVASAKAAYLRFQERFSSSAWRALARKGARVQRPLWASTGTKNPHYSDLLYVDNLIGAQTVTTLPPATLDAFRDHGLPRETLKDGAEEAAGFLARLRDFPIDLDEVTSRLEAEGVRLFADSYDKLLLGLKQKRERLKPVLGR